jgi:hypothetical protein
MSTVSLISAGLEVMHVSYPPWISTGLTGKAWCAFNDDPGLGSTQVRASCSGMIIVDGNACRT